MEWNNNKTIAFIQDYHNSPELWDIKIVNYKDIKIRNDKLTQLAVKFECTVLEVKKKIKNLRSQFHREHKRVKSIKSSGKKSKWFAYELLKFLLEVDGPRSPSSTEGSDEEGMKVKMENGESFINPLTVQFSATPGPSASGAARKLFRSRRKIKRIMKEVSDRDLSDIFGEYIASKHRRYSGYTKSVIENSITSILFDADMGKLNDPNLSEQPMEVYIKPETYYQSFSEESNSINSILCDAEMGRSNDPNLSAEMGKSNDPNLCPEMGKLNGPNLIEQPMEVNVKQENYYQTVNSSINQSNSATH